MALSATLISAVSNGVPAAGVDAVQGVSTLSTVTSGTFRLSLEGFVTGPISWTATTAILETALNALPSVGNGGTGSVGVVVTGGPLPGTALVVTFSGSNVAKKALGVLTLHRNDLVGGGTAVITNSTAGVNVFGRGLPSGAQVINGATGAVYFNNGSASTPSWSAI